MPSYYDLKDSRNHPDSVIHYLSSAHAYAPPIDQGDADKMSWEARWADNSFLHSPAPGTPGDAHQSPILVYLSFDGSPWSASWDAGNSEFVHTSLLDGDVHSDKRLNYLTWDRSKWTAVRDGDRFQHFFVADADYSHGLFAAVREFIDEHDNLIQLIIDVADDLLNAPPLPIDPAV